jgi:YHS domain-containing protein
MGKPYTFTHEGREIQLCCKDCLKDFKKDPAKFVKKLEAAEAKDKKS